MLKNKKTDGFSVVELLVVMVIIGILSGIGIAQFKSTQQKAEETKILAENVNSCKEIIAQCTQSQTTENCITYNDCVNGGPPQTIRKNAGASAWGSTGAESTKNFSGDGNISMSIENATSRSMLGLSTTNINHDYSTIEFAIYLRYGVLYLYESGSNLGTFGNYAINDTFSIAREGNQIKYYKNNSLFYTSSQTAPTQPLLADVAIFTGEIAKAKMNGVSIQWTNTNNVEIITD